MVPGDGQPLNSRSPGGRCFSRKSAANPMPGTYGTTDSPRDAGREGTTRVTTDQLMAWMAGHRAPTTACSRCGKPQVAYFRDHLERPIGPCCVGAAVKQADFDRKAIARRIHDLAHDCPAEGCQTCIQAGY